MDGKHGPIILRWAHLFVGLIVQVLLMGAVWGSLRYQVEEHERRLNQIELREQEKYLLREEFEKRHEDLRRQVEENREQLQRIQEERLAELQRRH